MWAPVIAHARRGAETSLPRRARSDESGVEAAVVGRDRMGVDVLVLPRYGFARLDLELGRIEVHLSHYDRSLRTGLGRRGESNQQEEQRPNPREAHVIFRPTTAGDAA